MTQKKPGDRRQHPRFDTSIDALAKSARGGRQRVEISDLSAGGCAVSVEVNSLKEGQCYGLKIRGLETLGCIATWTDGQSAGLMFQHPLHPVIVEHLAAQYPPAFDGELEPRAAS